jgi:hypothetical protein
VKIYLEFIGLNESVETILKAYCRQIITIKSLQGMACISTQISEVFLTALNPTQNLVSLAGKPAVKCGMKVTQLFFVEE